jgi:ribonuclease D
LEFNLIRFTYLSQQDQFDRFITQYEQAEVLFLDTEFVRTTTFYAQLGLIQVFDGQDIALIDTLADLDLSGFWALLQNSNIIKVLHSAYEDLEIFAYYGQCQPKPMFDTQLASSLDGLGVGVGYAKLVESLLGVVIDKSEARTNWLERPLSASQLDYAATDVLYLEQVYRKLNASLASKKRLDWVFDEGVVACAHRLDPLQPDLAYLDVKNAYQLNSEQLAVLQALAHWRLKTAVRKNMALGFIAKDNSLMLLAKEVPQTLDELKAIRGLLPKEKQYHAHDFLKCIQEGQQASVFPETIEVLYFNPLYKGDFQTLKQTLKSLAERHDLPLELIGSKKLIHQYLKWHWSGRVEETPTILKGWRGQLCREALEKAL